MRARWKRAGESASIGADGSRDRQPRLLTKQHSFISDTERPTTPNSGLLRTEGVSTLEDRLRLAIDKVLPTGPSIDRRSLVRADWHLSLDVEKTLSDVPLNYLCVGVLGRAGIGKSKLMNALARTAERQSPMKQGSALMELISTPNRILLLDTSPILSQQQKSSKKKSISTESVATQNAKLASILLSVCNIVFVILDLRANDYAELDLLVQASQLKEKVSKVLEKTSQPIAHQPRLLFVVNRISGDTHSPALNAKIMDEIESRFEMTSLKPGTIKQGYLFPYEGKYPLIFLPRSAEHVSSNEGDGLDELPMDFDETVDQLRHFIVSHPRSELQRTRLSEREWFRYFVKVVDLAKRTEVD